MRLFVRFDEKGKIISTMKANAMAAELEHPYGELEDGEAVLEVEPTPEIEALDCHEISENYVVDARSERLKPKGETQAGRKRRRDKK